jgi:Protein of unknown function (DUF2384)
MSESNNHEEMLEIITRISKWAGSDAQALAWYRAEPIPAFGGRTAESLVKDGKTSAVRDYLSWCPRIGTEHRTEWALPPDSCV